MFPILFEIPNALDMPGGFLAGEVVFGVLCGLLWLYRALKGRKDWVTSAANMGGFLVLLHVGLSWAMGEQRSVTIYSFGVVIILGFFAGASYLVRRTRPLRLDDKRVFDWAFWMLVVGIVGSRIFYALINYELFADNKMEVFRIWNGGLVWYGGLIPAALVAFPLLRRYKLPALHVADLGAAAVMLALGIGRWACFLAGDDYGRPTDAWWGIRFYEGSHGRPLVDRALYGVALHPTQLLMSVTCLWIFFLTDQVRRRARQAGTAFGTMLILYAVTRSVLIEPLRGDFVERNPRYSLHAAATITVTKGEASPALRFERGMAVRDAGGRSGSLLDGLDLPAGKATGTLHAITDEPAAPRRSLLGSAPPEWNVLVPEGTPSGVEFDSRTRTYASDLPVPPGYVSTSQWISIVVVLAGVGIILLCRRLKLPPYAEAVKQAQAEAS